MDFDTILKFVQIIIIIGGCYVTIKVQIAKLQGDVKMVKRLVSKFLGNDADRLTEILSGMRKEVTENKTEIHKIKKRVTRLENK